MRYLLFILLILSTVEKSNAQFSVDVNYLQLRSKEWDDIIRTYNFARPWREDRQPFLTNGVSASLGWYFRLSGIKSTFLKPSFSYSRFGSRSGSDDQRLVLTVEQYSFQVDFNFNPRAIFNDVSAGPLGTRFFISLSPGVSRWTAKLKRNDEEYMIDEEEKYRPVNYNVYIAAGIGFRAALLGKSWVLTPVARLRYYPRATIDGLAEAVQGSNQTGLLDRSKNMLLIVGGVECTRIFQVRKGKKGYGIGVPLF